ncbi:MAG: OmpW family outer membrane protein, partial [Pseudomonadota bacterium]|nr:OmpW family outer membrane protein [Pseudomonadota bacterium]
MKKVLKPLSLAAAISAAMVSGHVAAYEAGDWIVRAGITTVDPQESGDQLELNGSTAAFIGAVGTEELGLDSDTQLGLTGEYMLTNNWGIEVLAATPFQHTATATDTLAGLDIADIKHLPPTVSAVYHFDTQGNLDPYIGVGINYTIFFSEDTTSAADAAFAGLGL